MKLAKINSILDQILAAMDLILFKDQNSIEQYNATLKSLLEKLPSATYKSITNDEIRTKVQTIWYRSVAKHQGPKNKKNPQLSTPDINARKNMIEHGFYVDCVLTTKKTTLIKLFEICNFTLVKPLLYKLKEQNTLTEHLATKYTLGKDYSYDVFQHIEATIDRGLQRKATGKSFDKIKQLSSFARGLIDILNELQLTHGFSAQIHEKIVACKNIKQVKNKCGKKRKREYKVKNEAAITTSMPILHLYSNTISRTRSDETFLNELLHHLEDTEKEIPPALTLTI